MLSRRMRRLVALSCCSFLGLSLHAAFSGGQAPGRQRNDAAATLAATMLTGSVRSVSGEALEGVAVSGRAVDKTFTTTVFTDGRGEYVFPQLDGGQYKVWAQAVGYDAGRAELSLDPSRDRRQDFTLTAIADLTMQLSGPEWIMALPEDTRAQRRMKQIFHNACTGCHQPHFVLQNRFDEAGWRAIVTAMQYLSPTGTWRKEPSPLIRYHADELVAYLTEMRGPEPSPMKFQLLPRPTGESARVVITEYDVPPAETPDRLVPHDGSDWSEGSPSAFLARGLHDMVVDFDGHAWFNDSVTNMNRSYARLDPKTGRVTWFKIPGGREGFLRGSHGMTIGPDGIIWMNVFAGEPTDADGTSGVGSLGRLDPRTEKFEIFSPPKGMNAVGGHLEVDGKGKVWTVTRQGALRFDPDTRQFTEFTSPTPGSRPYASNYGLGADAEGNGWWAIITYDKLGVGDAKTGRSMEIPLRSRPEMVELATAQDREFYRSFGGASAQNANIGLLWSQAPRRLGGDQKGHTMWVANWWGQNLAEVDIRTHKVTYHPVPIPYSGPYDVEVDNNHVAWVSLRNADRVVKFDPSTQQWTVYLLPTLGTEARNITVDRPRGEVWVPYWRTSKLARLQFRTEQEIRSVTTAQLQAVRP
jgi:streptogramin lyase